MAPSKRSGDPTLPNRPSGDNIVPFLGSLPTSFDEKSWVVSQDLIEPSSWAHSRHRRSCTRAPRWLALHLLQQDSVGGGGELVKLSSRHVSADVLVVMEFGKPNIA